eukprot:3859311-Rhodomonas_salina.1
MRLQVARVSEDAGCDLSGRQVHQLKGVVVDAHHGLHNKRLVGFCHSSVHVPALRIPEHAQAGRRSLDRERSRHHRRHFRIPEILELKHRPGAGQHSASRIVPDRDLDTRCRVLHLHVAAVSGQDLRRDLEALACNHTCRIHENEEGLDAPLDHGNDSVGGVGHRSAFERRHRKAQRELSRQSIPALRLWRQCVDGEVSEPRHALPELGSLPSIQDRRHLSERRRAGELQAGGHNFRACCVVCVANARARPLTRGVAVADHSVVEAVQQFELRLRHKHLLVGAVEVRPAQCADLLRASVDDGEVATQAPDHPLALKTKLQRIHIASALHAQAEELRKAKARDCAPLTLRRWDKNVCRVDVATALHIVQGSVDGFLCVWRCDEIALFIIDFDLCTHQGTHKVHACWTSVASLVVRRITDDEHVVDDTGRNAKDVSESERGSSAPALKHVDDQPQVTPSHVHRQVCVGCGIASEGSYHVPVQKLFGLCLALLQRWQKPARLVLAPTQPGRDVCTGILETSGCGSKRTLDDADGRNSAHEESVGVPKRAPEDPSKGTTEAKTGALVDCIESPFLSSTATRSASPVTLQFLCSLHAGTTPRPSSSCNSVQFFADALYLELATTSGSE